MRHQTKPTCKRKKGQNAAPPPPPVMPKNLPIIVEFIALPDGHFLMKPKLCSMDQDAWISPKLAADLIGLRLAATYQLCEECAPMLVSRRPAKSKILISLKSVRAFIAATAGVNFWEDKIQQSVLINEVRRQLTTLRQDA